MEFHSVLCFVEFIEVENLVSLPLHLLNNQTRVGDLVFIQDLSQRLSIARKPTLYSVKYLCWKSQIQCWGGSHF